MFETAPVRRGLGTTSLPSSLPSTPGSSLQARNFSIPGSSSMNSYPMSLASSSSTLVDSSYPPQSPAFALHSSNSNTAGSSNPAYRRPNPQHLPPGAQTPDVSLSFQAFSPLDNAMNANSGPISPPNSVPNSTTHSASSSYSISRSTTPIPQVSTRVQPIEEGAEGGLSSGMDRPSVPGSPDPKRRGVNKWS